MDKIAGVDQLTPAADKIRRLMQYGQILQSHASHFFYLASPDILFGFGAPAEKRNVVAVARHYPDLALKGIKMRKFGQEMISATGGGKRIHPNGAIPGGVNKNLTSEERDYFLKDIDQIISWAMEGIELFKKVFYENKDFMLSFGSFESNFISLVRSDGAMDLYDGRLRAINKDGKTIFEGVPPEAYLDYIREEVRSWSYMKFPYILSLGKEEGWYRVGPLARLNACDFIDTPLAENERQEFIKLGKGRPVHATMAYHWARLIEMVHAAEKMKEILPDPDLQSDKLMAYGQRRFEAMAWLEAPRGTLFHHYRVNENDQVTMGNLIVSTTSNNEAFNRAVDRVARDYLSGKTITDELLNHIEVAIRAFDPCLSCATHALGQMPLHVQLEDHLGKIIDEKGRF
jgi:NAD-reducing hydrogenase large subunit